MFLINPISTRLHSKLSWWQKLRPPFSVFRFTKRVQRHPYYCFSFFFVFRQFFTSRRPRRPIRPRTTIGRTVGHILPLDITSIREPGSLHPRALEATLEIANSPTIIIASIYAPLEQINRGKHGRITTRPLILSADPNENVPRPSLRFILVVGSRENG